MLAGRNYQEEGSLPLVFCWKLKEMTLFWGEMPRLWASMGEFPHDAFCLFVIAEMFLEVALFLQTSVLKNSWLQAWSTTMVSWQRKPLGFEPARPFTLAMNSGTQNIKLTFYSHDT